MGFLVITLDVVLGSQVCGARQPGDDAWLLLRGALRICGVLRVPF
jgi:hypothetical protein